VDKLVYIVALVLLLLALGGIIYIVWSLFLAILKKDDGETIQSRFVAMFFGRKSKDRLLGGGPVGQITLLVVATLILTLVVIVVADL